MYINSIASSSIVSTGKTSLRKTLFGESFKPDEEPTKCIYADSSMARIQFRQYREWIIQPSSKADAHRLNLEYNDAIIDYILNEVRKPGVSDEVVDLKKLGLHKQPKNVNFESTPSIIPLLSSSSSSEKIEEETSNVSVTNSIENTSSSFVSSSETSSSSSPSFTTSPNRGRQGTIVAKPTSTLDGSDDISEVEEGPVPQEEPSSLPSDPSVPAPTPPTTNEKSKTKLTIFDSTLEMSKVLMEHIPFEVLKRLVMRWPVDGEDVMDLESLSRRRLLIHVWDCSGDPLQLSVVPLFFSSRSIFLVMHNMENNLSHQAQSYLKQNLTNLRGSCPTNAQALEEWVAGITAQTEDTPTGPRPMHQSFPQLPPIIFVASHSDSEEVLNPFNEFFTLPSFNSYNRHMLETNFVAVSNFHESSLIDDYSGHHYLRREIDHLARQMPYIHDMIPVQWVKFEQLLHLLIEQKKVVIQLSDLERYISDRCDIIGPLQVQPALAYYNQIGIVVHMYKHPALAPLIVVKPQWLLDALASVFASSSTSWITVEVRQSFATLYTKGYIRRDILLLAYRCAHLPQRYWNELLYFINYMDLIACHSSLHESTSIFIPAVVNKTAPTFSFGPTGNDPATLYFSCGSTVLPMSLFNQLVVRCIRTCAYVPVLFHEIVHLRLNYSHHLILRREGPSICVLVQTNTVQFCSYCPENEKSYEVQQECNHLTHIVDHDKGTSTSEHLETYQLFIDQLPNVMLYLSDDLTMLDEICPRVLSFLEDSMEFLMRCWYPGLRFKLTTENELLIDRKWKQNVLEKGLAPPKLALWFNY